MAKTPRKGSWTRKAIPEVTYADDRKRRPGTLDIEAYLRGLARRVYATADRPNPAA